MSEQPFFRIVKFYTEYRTGKDPVDWVVLAPMGEDFTRTQTPHSVRKLDPEGFPEEKRRGDSYQLAVARWETIGPAYEAWKRGNAIPEHGTPLEAWAGATAELVAALKANDIRTVEELAAVSETAATRIRVPNIRQLRDTAQKFLEGQSSAEKDAEMAELKAKLATLEAALNEEKPKRGRPRKESEAA